MEVFTQLLDALLHSRQHRFVLGQVGRLRKRTAVFRVDFRVFSDEGSELSWRELVEGWRKHFGGPGAANERRCPQWLPAWRRRL